MKKLIALTLAGIIMFVACAKDVEEDIPRRDRSTTAETTADEPNLTTQPPGTTNDESEQETPPSQETPPIITLCAQGQAFYDIIMANKSVWEEGYMFGGTLIDLDFDGTPEFLVLAAGENEWTANEIHIYKLNLSNNTMTKVTQLVSDDRVGICGGESSHRSIALYTDNTGKRSWAVPYSVVSANTTEERLSLFDFTGSTVKEYVKFSSVRPNNDERWDMDNWRVFIDGNEFFLTAAEIQKYAIVYARYQAELAWYERDREDYLANSAQEFYDYEGLSGEKSVNPPRTAHPIGFLSGDDENLHANAAGKWFMIKHVFELGLIPTAHKLDPNFHWDMQYGGFIQWNTATQPWLEMSVKRLAQAYVNNDEDYLLDPDAYSLGAMAKPVIYLYPEQVTDINVQVRFSPGGYFTVTYPCYGDQFGRGWDVTARPDGTLFNKADGLEYSYLYWDGNSPMNWDFSEGFVIAGRDTVTFLREMLIHLGLTPREYNEFIVYWLPLMQNNKYNLITFQTTLYEQAAQLLISPKPDSVQRVFMVYKPLDAFVEIPPQVLPAWERNGFSVVEWGGTMIG
jgi:hypothetical protein